MRKIISFMHMSLDGFVAGPNGELHWFKVDDELFDYVGKRIHEGDTAMYGRTTYHLMESYWPKAGQQPDATKHAIEHAGWYNSVHKIVLSTTLKEQDLRNTEVISSNVPDRINAIKQQEGKDILLFGSPSATHALMAQNLVDGFWLFVNPIVFGQGVPLFSNVRERMQLTLLPTTRQFKSGVTELNYLVNR